MSSLKNGLKIGDLTAQSGQTLRGWLQVGTRPGGAPLKIPFFLIKGVEDGPVLLVDACNHGSEYEGPPAVIRIARSLDPSKLRGTVIAVPVVNLPSFEEGRRESSIDGVNINRIWPGDETRTISYQIAFHYFREVVEKANYVVTHHSGGRDLQHPPLVAFQDEGDEMGKKSRELARAFGTKYLTRWTPFDGALVKETWKRGIVTLNPEAGGVDRSKKTFWENVDALVNGTVGVMRQLGMLEGEPQLPPKQIVTRTIAEPPLSYVRLKAGGLFIPEVNIEDSVKKGTVLGRLTDLFGDDLQVIEAPMDALVLGLHYDCLSFPGEFATILGEYEETVENA